MMRIFFPDNSSTEISPGTTGLEVASSISGSLAKKALAFSLDGVLHDISSPVPAGGRIRIITPADDEALEIIRHSCAHLLAAAVLELYPDAIFGIGPSIEDGFYYDMVIPGFGGESDLAGIRNKMRNLVKKNLPFRRSELTLSQARELFSRRGERFKMELLSEIEDRGETISLYSLGISPTCAGDPMCRPRSFSPPLNSSAWPGPTGGAARRMKCSQGYMERPFPPRKS